MKVYWSKTAVLGFMFFTISLILVLSFKDSLSHPSIGIYLSLFGIFLSGIYAALPKIEPAKPKKEKEKKEISDLYAFSMLFCLLISALSLAVGIISTILGNIEINYICATIFGVSFTAFLYGSWWKITNIASKANWSEWGWI